VVKGMPGMNRRRPGGRRRSSLRRLLRGIGPELVSAASDNDPTNVGTAAAVGAQTGYQLSWVALLVAPLLGVVLTIAAQVGAVARDDLQSLTLKRYGRGAAAVLLVSVVAVNLVTIAADLQAGAASIGLLAGVDSRWLVAPLGAALAGLLLAGKYAQVVAVLRYLMLGFAAFGAAAVLAHPDWPRLLQASLVPALSLRPEEVAGGLALLGTTLTSYVYVWETIGRGVEEPADGTADGGGLARARAGAIIGAVFTAVILWFMLVASAATLGRHHQAVTSAQDAAGAQDPGAPRGAGQGAQRPHRQSARPAWLTSGLVSPGRSRSGGRSAQAAPRRTLRAWVHLRPISASGGWLSPLSVRLLLKARKANTTVYPGTARAGKHAHLSAIRYRPRRSPSRHRRGRRGHGAAGWRWRLWRTRRVLRG
jgi:hypothetical protein